MMNFMARNLFAGLNLKAVTIAFDAQESGTSKLRITALSIKTVIIFHQQFIEVVSN